MVNGLQDYQLGQVITAIGGLGTAAFGLVDAAQVGLPRHQPRRIGAHPSGGLRTDPRGRRRGQRRSTRCRRPTYLETLEANWVNGVDLASQKAIAKSLIKLHLSAGMQRPSRPRPASIRRC
jgi:hypothetical protein